MAAQVFKNLDREGLRVKDGVDGMRRGLAGLGKRR
jgi:hypothetical protein